MTSTNDRMQVIGVYGVNASGKSTLSHLLAREFIDYDVEATDNLLAVKKMLTPHNVILNYSSYSQWERFGEPTSTNIWRGFQEYRESMRDYLTCILERARDQKVGMVIEGVHIIPEHFLSFTKYLDIRLFLLHIEDPEIHKQRIFKKCDYRPTLLVRLQKYFPHIRELQKELVSEAKDFPIKVIETGVSMKRAVQEMRNSL